MTPPIRLFISDIDGTLIRKDKTLGQPVVDAAARLHAAGVTMSLISARPLSGMIEHARRLGITAPIGAFNGGTIARPDGEIISARHLDPALAARTLDLLDAPNVSPWLFADGIWYAQTTEGAHVPSERITAATEPVIVSDFSDLLARVDKIVGVSDDREGLAALERKVAEALGDGANVIRSQTYYLDVTAPEANKGAGVTAIAKALGVPLEATAVIGDQGNDLKMFAVAGLSIAVGNATPDVQAAADETAAAANDDGVADAIDRIVIPASKA